MLAAPQLRKTGSRVRHWDRQLTEQTDRRASTPAHYSTGTLDPQIALVRQLLERRRWTFRNLARMNVLLGLVRLRINRMDITERWAGSIASAAAGGLEALAGAADRRRRPAVAHASRLNEEGVLLLDGSREYSLRKHAVVSRDGSLPGGRSHRRSVGRQPIGKERSWHLH